MKRRVKNAREPDDTFGAEPSEATTLPDGRPAVGRRGEGPKSGAVTEAEQPATQPDAQSVERGTQRRTAAIRSRVTRTPKS